jgi:uncharacterized membrane protein
MPRKAALSLAALLATAGTAHFVRPRPFDDLIPDALPGAPRAWTYASGAAELALAAGLLVPATRRRSALAAAAFFVAVFPGNVTMAYRWRNRPLSQRALAYGRLPLQVPLVAWARSATRA